MHIVLNRKELISFQ